MMSTVMSCRLPRMRSDETPDMVLDVRSFGFCLRLVRRQGRSDADPSDLASFHLFDGVVVAVDVDDGSDTGQVGVAARTIPAMVVTSGLVMVRPWSLSSSARVTSPSRPTEPSSSQIGAIFNEASRAMPDLDPVEPRRARWFDAIDELERRNEQLLVDVAPFADHPVLGPLVDDVESGMVGSLAELDDIRDPFTDDPTADDSERHQNRTAQLIVRVEKVIDLPKPELADDGRYPSP